MQEDRARVARLAHDMKCGFGFVIVSFLSFVAGTGCTPFRAGLSHMPTSVGLTGESGKKRVEMLMEMFFFTCLLVKMHPPSKNA